MGANGIPVHARDLGKLGDQPRATGHGFNDHQSSWVAEESVSFRLKADATCVTGTAATIDDARRAWPDGLPCHSSDPDGQDGIERDEAKQGAQVGDRMPIETDRASSRTLPPNAPDFGEEPRSGRGRADQVDGTH
jgi:hypothetical protein